MPPKGIRLDRKKRLLWKVCGYKHMAATLPLWMILNAYKTTEASIFLQQTALAHGIELLHVQLSDQELPRDTDKCALEMRTQCFLSMSQSVGTQVC